MYDYIILNSPSIVSRLHSVSNYFEPNNTTYFEAGDPSSLAEKIVDLFHHPEKGLLRLSQAKRLYQKHGWKSQSGHYLSAYKCLLSELSLAEVST